MTEGDARSTVADFVRALALLATLGGAYWGAAALDLRWAFWLLVVLAASYAAVRWAWPRARDRFKRAQQWMRRASEYPRLLQIVAERQAEVETLQASVRELEVGSELRLADGIREGRRRVVGETLALTGGAILMPIAVGVQENDLVIAADSSGGPDPELESIWCLRVKGMGTIKAMLRVTDVPGPGQTMLTIDSIRDAPFMEALLNNAALSSDFPLSLEVVPRGSSSIRDFEEEA